MHESPPPRPSLPSLCHRLLPLADPVTTSSPSKDPRNHREVSANCRATEDADPHLPHGSQDSQTRKFSSNNGDVESRIWPLRRYSGACLAAILRMQWHKPRKKNQPKEAQILNAGREGGRKQDPDFVALSRLLLKSKFMAPVCRGHHFTRFMYRPHARRLET